MLAGDMPNGHLASIRLEATDLNGVPIDKVVTGEEFYVHAYFEDRRGEPDVNITPNPDIDLFDEPYGVFEAPFNLTYNMDGFEFDSTYIPQAGDFNPQFGISLFEEVDGFLFQLEGVIRVDFNLQPIYGDEMELFSFRMIAEDPGVYSGDQGFMPHFHFDVLQTFIDPNDIEPQPEPVYVNGVPQLERLTGQELQSALDRTKISMYFNGGNALDNDTEVFFEGFDLEVIEDTTTADFEMRVVTIPTSINSQGETATLPNDTEWIDEWDFFYVEIYAKGDNGNAIQSATVDIQFDPNHYRFVDASGRDQDTRVRYNVSTVDDQTGTGHVIASFTSIFEDTGDDDYALIGRVRLASNYEVANDTTNGYQSPIISSAVSFAETNATVIDSSDNSRVIINGDLATSSTFEVWPVIYDADDNEDGSVGLVDFSGFASVFGQPATTPKARKFDFDQSGSINLTDFVFFVQNFGQSANVLSVRSYPDDFPFDPAPPLMGSQFTLEGEPTNWQQPAEPEGEQASTFIVPQKTTAALTGSITSELADAILVPPVTLDDDPIEAAAESAEPSQTPSVADFLPVQNTLDQQVELIASTIDDSDSVESGDSSNSADEVLANWEDEYLL